MGVEELVFVLDPLPGVLPRLGRPEGHDQGSRAHGRIVDGHWSARHAAGVAICCRHLPAGRLQWSLHRSLGGLDAGRPELSPLLAHTAGESARASSILSGMAQRLAVARLFALNRNVIGALEA